MLVYRCIDVGGFVTLVFERVHLDSKNMQNNANKLTDRSKSRPATPEFCVVKLLFLSMESGKHIIFHFQLSTQLKVAFHSVILVLFLM